MRRIAIATDFSTRSDRALRRATLLARAASADLVILHVVDDDQAPPMVRVAQREASALLDDLAATARDVDGVECSTRVLLGEPFQAISRAAEELSIDLLVMGPHRRQALRDVFLGTTVERTIREVHRPLVMANGVPAGDYRRMVIATDMSTGSATALKAVAQLGMFDRIQAVALHVFDLSPQITRASLDEVEQQAYVADAEERAGTALAAFVRKQQVGRVQTMVTRLDQTVSHTILAFAKKQNADLLVLGTNGRSGVGRLILGSVSEDVLRDAELDVLVVPPEAAQAAHD